MFTGAALDGGQRKGGGRLRTSARLGEVGQLRRQRRHAVDGHVVALRCADETSRELQGTG